MKLLTLTGFIIFTNSGFLFGQTDSSKNSSTVMTYSIDTYYRYDLNDAPNKTNNLTSFTNSKNSFELGMASIKAEHAIGKISATADLGFGRRAQEYSYNDAGTMMAIKQLYLSYTPIPAIRFTMGKWATHIGYELVDAYANRNYSISYAFTYGPFFHTGLKADISLGGKSALMLGIANPTDFSTTTSANKVVLAQFSTATKNERLKTYLNFQGGTGFSQFDLVLNGSINRQFSINYDGTIKSVKNGTTNHSWNSNAIYLNFDPANQWGITLRTEYFNDPDKITVAGTSVLQTTLSGNIHLQNLTLIPEFRIDHASQEIFNKSNGAGTGLDACFLLAAVYKF